MPQTAMDGCNMGKYLCSGIQALETAGHKHRKSVTTPSPSVGEGKHLICF